MNRVATAKAGTPPVTTASPSPVAPWVAKVMARKSPVAPSSTTVDVRNNRETARSAADTRTRTRSGAIPAESSDRAVSSGRVPTLGVAGRSNTLPGRPGQHVVPQRLGMGVEQVRERHVGLAGHVHPHLGHPHHPGDERPLHVHRLQTRELQPPLVALEDPGIHPEVTVDVVPVGEATPGEPLHTGHPGGHHDPRADRQGEPAEQRQGHPGEEEHREHDSR